MEDPSQADWGNRPWEDAAVTKEVNADRWEQEMEWRDKGRSPTERIRLWQQVLAIPPKQRALEEGEKEGDGQPDVNFVRAEELRDGAHHEQHQSSDVDIHQAEEHEESAELEREHEDDAIQPQQLDATHSQQSLEHDERPLLQGEESVDPISGHTRVETNGQPEEPVGALREAPSAIWMASLSAVVGSDASLYVQVCQWWWWWWSCPLPSLLLVSFPLIYLNCYHCLATILAFDHIFMRHGR